MNVIRSAYANKIAALRDRKDAPARTEELEETRARVAEAARRGASAAGLRDHQDEALKEMGKHFARGGARSLVVIPAAGEKRSTFVAAIEKLGVGGRKIGGRSWFPNTVVLTPSISSVGSILREIRAARPDLRDVGHMASGRVVDGADKKVEPGFGIVTVMTYAGFKEYAKNREIRPGDVDLLIMNEAHEGLSDMRQNELAPFLGTSVVTAFTGTPAFDDFKSVHRLLGDDSEVYSISARDLRNRGEIPPITNYLMAVNLETKGEVVEGKRATIQKRKALVDGVLNHLFGDAEAALAEALRERVSLFYGADREHAEMFAREYDLRHRRDPTNRLEVMRAYRREWEAKNGKHDPERSVLREEMLHALAAQRPLGEGEPKSVWFGVKQELRSATDPKDVLKHVEAMGERIAAMKTPMRFIDGTQSASEIADVMDRVRAGEIRFMASAQMFDGMDIPNVGVVINTPTESLLRCLQQGAQVQRSRDTGFVLNPYFVVDGEVEGFPRFFYEASNDMEMGEPIEFDPRYFADVDVDGYEDAIDANEAAAIEALAARRAEERAEDEEDDDYAEDLQEGDAEVDYAEEAPAAPAAPKRPQAKPGRAPAIQPAPPLRPMPPRATPPAQPAAAQEAFRSAFRPAPIPAPARPAAREFAGARTAVIPAHRPATSRIPRPGADRRPLPVRPTPTAQHGVYTTKEAKIDAIVRLIKQRDLFRNAGPRDADYLSKREFCARMAIPSGRSGPISRLYLEFEEALLRGEMPTYKGEPVAAQAFRDGHVRWIGLKTADADRIARDLGHHPDLPVRTAEWLSLPQVGRRLQATGNPLVEDIFRELAHDWGKKGAAATRHFSMVRVGNRTMFALHKDGLAWFEAEFTRRRPAPRRKGEMQMRDACLRLGFRNAARAEAVWKQAVMNIEKNVPVDRREDVPFRKAIENGREIAVIGEAGLPWLARQFGVAYHGVIAFDARYHARLEDAVRLMEADRPTAAKLKEVYDRHRKTHREGRPVVIDGLQVSATLVRPEAGQTSEQFALPLDCLPALAREARIGMPQPEPQPEDEPESRPGLGM